MFYLSISQRKSAKSRKTSTKQSYENDLGSQQGLTVEESLNIVSPLAKNEIKESCVFPSTENHHNFPVERRRSSEEKMALFRPPFFEETSEMLLHKAASQEVLDSPRMSPSSQFLTVDSNYKRCDKSTGPLIHQVSQSFSMPNSSFDAPCVKKCPIALSSPGLDMNPSVPNEGCSTIRYHIHDENRGAFNRSALRDLSDIEVENTLSYHIHDGNPWRNISWLEPQPVYHKINRHQPHHHYQSSFYQQAQHQPYYYPHYVRYNYHPGYYHSYHSVPYTYSQYHFMGIEAPQADIHNYCKKRKHDNVTKSSRKQDYYVYTDRPTSPMSDITGCPSGSFDCSDECFTTEHSGDEEIYPYKRLKIETSSNLYIPPLGKEPRIHRNGDHPASDFDWLGEEIVARTVSPIKGTDEVDMPQKATSVNQQSGTKIFRSRRNGTTQCIANNVSNTYSE